MFKILDIKATKKAFAGWWVPKSYIILKQEEIDRRGNKVLVPL